MKLTEAEQRKKVIAYIEERLTTYGNVDAVGTSALAYAHLNLNGKHFGFRIFKTEDKTSILVT